MEQNEQGGVHGGRAEEQERRRRGEEADAHREAGVLAGGEASGEASVGVGCRSRHS